MNWDAVAALAEAFGAIGVIVTLVFLARQIQQNTSAVRASTNHALTQQRNDLNVKFGLDPPAVELLLRGARSFEGLDFNERYRYTLLMRAVVGVCEDTFVQYSEGMCGPEPWSSAKVVLGPIAAAPTFATWWDQHGEVYYPAFRREVDAICAAAQQGVAADQQQPG